MELADEDDPLVKVTWHIEESVLRWLTDQSRETGAPRAAIARRLLAEGMVRQLTVWTAAPGMILPEVVGPPGPWREAVVVEAPDGTEYVRPTVRVETKGGADHVDAQTGEVLARERGRGRPGRKVGAAGPGPVDAVAEGAGRGVPVLDDGAGSVAARVAAVGEEVPAAPSKARGGQGEVAVSRPKVRHHDDEVVGGGAMVKCRRCTLVKNAARPEVCDG
jgi:hypothetical protein